MQNPPEHGDIERVPARDWTDETTTRIQKQRERLSWQIRTPLQPCRSYQPGDLWNTHALKKAILQELDTCTTEAPWSLSSYKNEDHGTSGHRAEYCLHNTLHCWHAHLKRNQAVGPSFLIHILEGEYDGKLSLDNLVGDDEKVATTMIAAKPDNIFHVLLAKMERLAWGVFMDYGSRCETLGVESTRFLLREIVQLVGNDVDIYPGVSEVDLLDEWYYEDKPPEACYNDGTKATWMRTVSLDIIIAIVRLVLMYRGSSSSSLPSSLTNS
jgi:hypothetical protein